MATDIPAWDLAEEACKKQLTRIHGTLEEGMKIHGTKEFDRMVAGVEKAIENFCRCNEDDD